MRIIKSLINTLKTELKLIKVKDITLNFTTTTSENDIKPNIKTIDETLIPKTKSENFSFDIKINAQILSNKNLKIKDLSLSSHNVEIKNGSFIINDIQTNNLVVFSNKQLKIKNLKMILKAKINEINKIQLKIKNNMLPQLFILTFLPASSIEKNKILELLKKLIINYRNSDIRFVGFYKNIPIGYAEKVIVKDKTLIVYTKKDGKNISKDIAVFKINGKYRLEVVEN